METDQEPSAVFDNGRRGEPLPGCDCVRCFGYCMIDRDVAARELAEMYERQAADAGGAE